MPQQTEKRSQTWYSADALLHTVREQEIERLNRTDPEILWQFGFVPGIPNDVPVKGFMSGHECISNHTPVNVVVLEPPNHQMLRGKQATCARVLHRRQELGELIANPNEVIYPVRSPRSTKKRGE